MGILEKIARDFLPELPEGNADNTGEAAYPCGCHTAIPSSFCRVFCSHFPLMFGPDGVWSAMSASRVLLAALLLYFRFGRKKRA